MLKKNITYSDIPFFMTKNSFTGDLNLVKDLYAIKQALKNLVMTIKREKPFNYLFGANPRNYLFEQTTSNMLFECKNVIITAINTFEPRVSVRDIGIEQSKINHNRINIIIVYEIVETQTVDTVTISLERTR
jgi:phage baseplate assembly protein W